MKLVQFLALMSGTCHGYVQYTYWNEFTYTNVDSWYQMKRKIQYICVLLLLLLLLLFQCPLVLGGWLQCEH